MDQKDYMQIPLKLVPKEFMDKYKLHDKQYKGHIYMEIFKGMYGLPQTGKLANDLLLNRRTN